MKSLILLTFTLLCITLSAAEPVPVFITIGQSNADGSAFPDKREDERLRKWFESDANKHNVKIWYRPCFVSNEPANALGDEARIVTDAPADKVDAQPGWMDVWYRNENRSLRTAMNMIHGCGTWSTGSGRWTAQGRRGMEPALAQILSEKLPETPIYLLKLGASGSHISAWANEADDRNWLYFKRNIFDSAMADLRERGLEPVIVGVWWMQGCSDMNRDSTYYRRSLETLINRLDTLANPNPPIYIGHIVKPGENSAMPDASRHFGPGVRAAQDAAAAAHDNVHIIDTSGCSFQYEKGFGGHLHIDHLGQRHIAEMLAPLVIAYWREYIMAKKAT